jgi:hypothetical protein
MKVLLLAQAQPGTEIKIASAFFTSFEILEKMAAKETEIKMIVRLNFGTNPVELKKALALKNVSIRIFTSNHFHPKFYIFGSRVAYLGSSNFTNSGLMDNQEVNIEIDEDDPVFSELEDVFFEYWNSAHPLEMKEVDQFAKIVKDLPKPNPSYDIKRLIGDFDYNNAGRENGQKGGSSSFVESFKREYQVFLKKHAELEEIYISVGLRRFPSVPLRIEIDRFIWWVRETYASDEAVRNSQIKTISQLREFVPQFIQEFYSFESEFLESSTEPRYKILNEVFASKKTIMATQIEDIADSLRYVFSFHDYCDRYLQGWKNGIQDFITTNTEIGIKESFSYLLHGDDPYQERIYRCFKGEYKLKNFGKNSCTELYGLVNNENIPILNSRTRNSMEWLGFGKI